MDGRNQRLAMSAILGASYFVLTVVVGPISYGPVNLRFANVLIGVVPILGVSSIFGLTGGVFFANIFSPLGPIDLLSPIFALIGLSILYLLRKKSVALGLAIYGLILGLWVSFMLSHVIGLAYFPLFWFVLAGLLIVNIPAYVLYQGLKRRFVR